MSGIGEGQGLFSVTVIAALVLINLFTIYLFWHDKRCAEQGRRRTPEATLLTWALIGGTPGAFWARSYFRHKTRKQPFSTMLWLILMIQIGALIGGVLI